MPNVLETNGTIKRNSNEPNAGVNKPRAGVLNDGRSLIVSKSRRTMMHRSKSIIQQTVSIKIIISDTTIELIIANNRDSLI